MHEHVFVSRHPVSTRRTILRLVDSGVSLRRIALTTGVTANTVRRWLDDPDCLLPVCEPNPEWRPPDGPAYAYLLGLYLGDGCLTTKGRHAVIAITLDALYPQIIGKTTGVLDVVFPGSLVRPYRHKEHRKTVVCLTNPSLPFAFPQHGPGKKHERKIELVPWQLELTRAYPERLLRGLIHSDGSRCMNRFDTKLPSGRVATYEYPRYFFTNYSEDIRRIFTDHCELLGIRWTQSNPRNISISHRDSVALLDAFIGPKA